MKKLKRYQWFGYQQYYPYGGQGDTKGEADTLDEMKAVISAYRASNPGWGFPVDNDVLDMKERRWLTETEERALGLPS